MNARGAMEIILALLALEAKLIDERLFVALVVMALATSVVAGPIMQSILRRPKPQRFTDYLGSKSFAPRLEATDRFAAMTTLCRISGAAGPDMEHVIEEVIAREQLLPTGIGNGIALSHVRLPDLKKPQVALGLSQQGIDFDSPDGDPCHAICLILTSEDDLGLGLELYRDAAATLLDKRLQKKLPQVNGYTEFLALLAERRGQGSHDTAVDTSGEQRDHALIVGATATARELAKLLMKTQPVVLIDSNGVYVEEAKREGLHAVLGNALDIEVLTEARARLAKFGLMMTTNPEINAIAARQLREIFQVPEIAIVLEDAHALTKADRLKPLDVSTLFGNAISLAAWDHWFSQNPGMTERVEITDSEQFAEFTTDAPTSSQLILAVEQGGETPQVVPFTSSTTCVAGDQLLVRRVQTLKPVG
jgi:mannitol/fructose-specific phosphotransferase system IIA component (Ntr-type)